MMLADIQGKVLRSEQLGGLRLTETKYAPRQKLAAHSHALACFGLVLTGNLQEESGMGTLAAACGSVIYRPHRLSHCNRFGETGARCVYVEFSERWLPPRESGRPFLEQPGICRTGRTGLLAKRIYSEWLDKDDVAQLAIEGLTCELAAEFCRDRDVRPPREPSWLTEVHDLVCDRFKNPPSLAEISEAVGIHRVHVVRQFRRFYGTTIGECIRRRRIEFACEMLAQANTPAVEIALEAGFAHQAHFSACFKKITGETASQYRRRMKTSSMQL